MVDETVAAKPPMSGHSAAAALSHVIMQTFERAEGYTLKSGRRALQALAILPVERRLGVYPESARPRELHPTHRRPGHHRHRACNAYGCCGQALTRFTRTPVQRARPSMGGTERGAYGPMDPASNVGGTLLS